MIGMRKRPVKRCEPMRLISNLRTKNSQSSCETGRIENSLKDTEKIDFDFSPASAGGGVNGQGEQCSRPHRQNSRSDVGEGGRASRGNGN